MTKAVLLSVLTTCLCGCLSKPLCNTSDRISPTDGLSKAHMDYFKKSTDHKPAEFRHTIYPLTHIQQNLQKHSSGYAYSSQFNLLGGLLLNSSSKKYFNLQGQAFGEEYIYFDLLFGLLMESHLLHSHEAEQTKLTISKRYLFGLLYEHTMDVGVSTDYITESTTCLARAFGKTTKHNGSTYYTFFWLPIRIKPQTL